MPTKLIDGVSSDLQFFWCDGDGNYIPLTEVQDITFQGEIQQDPSCARYDFTYSGELCFSVSMTPESSKRFKKMLKSIENMLNRQRRTEKRRKEKARRDRLKGG